MKNRHIALAGLCLIALAAAGVARAADEPAKVAGKWALSMEGGPRTVFQTLTLEQDGAKIKGTLQGPRGTLPFEGSVKGKAIHFNIKRGFPDQDQTIEYSGTVNGDTMKGFMRAGGQTRNWTARRLKEQDSSSPPKN